MSSILVRYLDFRFKRDLFQSQFNFAIKKYAIWCVFQPAFWCYVHPKAGRNTQQPLLRGEPVFISHKIDLIWTGICTLNGVRPIFLAKERELKPYKALKVLLVFS